MWGGVRRAQSSTSLKWVCHLPGISFCRLGCLQKHQCILKYSSVQLFTTMAGCTCHLWFPRWDFMLQHILGLKLSMYMGLNSSLHLHFHYHKCGQGLLYTLGDQCHLLQQAFRTLASAPVNHTPTMFIPERACASRLWLASNGICIPIQVLKRVRRRLVAGQIHLSVNSEGSWKCLKLMSSTRPKAHWQRPLENYSSRSNISFHILNRNRWMSSIKPLS